MNGLLLIDKPTDCTSFQVIRAVRKAANMRKVGHTGTLDPLASGLLVVCLGQGTKLVPFLMDSEKHYMAEVALGFETDTDDALGEVTEKAPIPALTLTSLKTTLAGFIGVQQQVPPKYSALKKDGEPLYRKARRGEIVEPEARQIKILKLESKKITASGFELDVRCGKGTYIRSLARDIARSLGTCGHLAALRRIETSGFMVKNAIQLEDLETASKQGCLSDHLLTLADALPSLPKLCLTKDKETRIRQGQSLLLTEIPGVDDLPQDSRVSLLGSDRRLTAIAKVVSDRLQPVRVIVD